MPKLPLVPDIPAGKRVTINDTDEVNISYEAEERFVFHEPQWVNDSAMHCGKCQLITINQGFTLVAYETEGLSDKPLTARFYCCTNCGHTRKK